MASEKDFELLDEYVSNRLTGQEKAAFEKKMDVDADLRNELALQQKVVEGIRNARAMELKTMLNNIPLSSIPNNGTSLLAKVGLWVAAAGLVGTGLYLYLSPSETPTTEAPAITKTVEEPVLEAVKPLEEQPASPLPDISTESKAAQEDASVKPNPAPEKKAIPVEKTEEKPVAPAALDVFDPTSEIENSPAQTRVIRKTGESTAPSIVVETATDKRYNFHYQFRDNKLYLYGAFEKNLYEIMEFFSNNKRTMFLYYKDNYYLLNEENDKVRALTPINDDALLKKLKDYRKN